MAVEELGEKLLERYADKDQFLSGMNAANGLKNLFAEGYEYTGQPLLISEFGGIAFASEEGWGYGNMVQDEEQFLERFKSIHKAIQNVPFICGYCYTQVSDVEQEINGIVRADRSATVPLEKLNDINQM